MLPKPLWILCVGILAVFAISCDSPSSVDDDNGVEGLIVQGVDLSHHNIDNYAPIDWTAVLNAGYTFAFVKATDGYNSCWTDPTLTTNMETGRRAGMLIGAYHYARPDLNP